MDVPPQDLIEIFENSKNLLDLMEPVQVKIKESYFIYFENNYLGKMEEVKIGRGKNAKIIS